MDDCLAGVVLTKRCRKAFARCPGEGSLHLRDSPLPTEDTEHRSGHRGDVVVVGLILGRAAVVIGVGGGLRGAAGDAAAAATAPTAAPATATGRRRTSSRQDADVSCREHRRRESRPGLAGISLRVAGSKCDEELTDSLERLFDFGVDLLTVRRLERRMPPFLGRLRELVRLRILLVGLVANRKDSNVPTVYNLKLTFQSGFGLNLSLDFGRAATTAGAFALGRD